MFIVHWFGEQAILTYHQILVDVTIPHIVTGIILYKIVHTASKRGHIRARKAELFKSPEQWKIHNHIWSRHPGKLADCPECATVVGVDEVTA